MAINADNEWTEIYIKHHDDNKYELVFDGTEIECTQDNFSEVIDKILESDPDFPLLRLYNFEVSDCLKFTDMKFIDRVKMLEISRIDVPDLDFLQYFSNVEHFSLSYNGDHNCQPFGINLRGIGYLKKLKSLELGDLWNSTGHLEYLRDLKQLEALYIHRIRLYNANDLYGMEKLKYLSLNGCCPDFSPFVLEGLPALEFLCLQFTDYGVKLEDIPEELLKRIKYLSLCTTHHISGASKLAVAKNLEYLNLQGNNITDVTPIGKISTLKKLDLAMNPVSDITPLQGLDNLVELLADNCSMSDDEVFERFPSLETFNLKDVNGKINKVYELYSVEMEYVKTKSLYKKWFM